MGYLLGKRSISNLAGVHPALVMVVKRAIEITGQDFLVLEGVRPKARQHELFGKGRTVAQLMAAGVDASNARPGLAKVTWTLNSNHFKQLDGFGHAVDLVPWPVDWNTPRKFDAIADAMQDAARDLGVTIRSGMDWDRDGKRRERGESDSPHFELWGPGL